MAVAKTSSDDDQFIKKFLFPLEPVLEVPASDIATIEKRIKAGLPMLIKDSGLVSPARRWTLDFLRDNLPGNKNTVYLSRTKKFKYWSDPDKHKLANFVPPTRRENMSMDAFCDRVAAWKPGQERLYMQHPLTEPVGQELKRDFLQFKWQWLEAMQRTGKWGPLTSNLLLVGQKGNTTPVHYDEQENLFAQVQGTKRFLLFDPQMFPCLYPYPIHHPHDRQSQVDLENLDFIRFPNCSGLSGFSVVVNPGDVLYIPMYWWHHVESMTDITESVTFWYKARPAQDQKIEYPLPFHQKLAIMRNIERIVSDAVGAPDEVAAFLVDMVSGRYGSSSIGSLDKLDKLQMQRSLCLEDATTNGQVNQVNGIDTAKTDGITTAKTNGIATGKINGHAEDQKA